MIDRGANAGEPRALTASLNLQQEAFKAIWWGCPRQPSCGWPACDTNEPTAPADLERFTTGLRIAWRQGEQRPTHRRPYRRRKPVPRRPSMLDDLHDQIRAWLAADPGVTATEILARVKALHPDRFTDKQARTVQRAVKQWRAQEARRIIIEGAAAIGAGLPSTSEIAKAVIRPAA